MSRPCPRAALGVVAVGLASLLVGPQSAWAHTGFDSSTPAEGEVVDAPVSSVVLTFTGDAEPAQDMVVALDGDGAQRSPVEISTDDQRSFTATFDPPLAGGDVGIRWAILSADGHRIEGSFSFTITAPSPATTAATTISTSPAGAEPGVAAAPTTVNDTEEDATPEAAEAVAVAEAFDDAASAPTANPNPDASAVAAPVDTEARSLEEFLAVEPGSPGGGRRLAGRLLSIPALAASIGAIAFLALVLHGSRREIVSVVSSVRIGAVMVAVGALIEYLGSIASTGVSFATGWAETPGRAMALRLVGAIVLLAGLRVATVSPTPTTLSAAVIDDPAESPSRSGRRGSPGHARWDPRSSPVAFVGVALLVISFWFDGHSVSKGVRPLHALVNSVHVVSGSVWFGGVVTLAVLAWWRHRRGGDARVGDLVLRFSSVATVALVAVGVAGVMLAVFVLDGFGDLTGTEWGKVLLLKTSGVGLAAMLGAYNHFKMRPALVAAPDDPAARATLRSVLTAEAILLTFVVVVTCWLVAAAT